MTNINCSLNCIYQKDGKCLYNSILPTSFSYISQCAYFVKNNNNDKES